MVANSRKSQTKTHDIWDDYPVYEGSDLGVFYDPSQTHIRIWAPGASELIFRLYEQGHGGDETDALQMKKDVDGTWELLLKGDWKNHYYTFQARIHGEWGLEVPDPQARAVGVNGNRGMIVDIKATNPDGWDNDKRPTLNSFADIVVWEVHVRDFSIYKGSGMRNKGKYLAFTETGTKSPEGLSSGIDHLKELGVTHVHLLPVADFSTVDESKPDNQQYNWGYDPKHYNVPEGSYSSNPYDGNVRIMEFKKMVQAIHSSGLRVIMDVVYNHMYDVASSPFNQLAPDYFFRKNPDGSYSNGSACGNETASERPMMRKFIVESLKYWAKEYHIDGFRFDLMGLLDIETMNLVRKEMDSIDPSIFLYGEGWISGETTLPNELRAMKSNADKLHGIAVFSDDIRDGIRGSWSDNEDPGFMAGKSGLKDSIKFGVVASTNHPQINYHKVNYSDKPYANNPLKTITFVTCHDNPCLWDKISYTCNTCNKQEKIDIQKFANAIVLTSQGIPFLHAGEEFARTKFGEHNSYNLPDSINQIVWSNKAKYYDVFTFYRDLISLRKNHPAFRMTTTEMIQKHLKFLDNGRELLVGFHISGHANGDSWKEILVYYNADKKSAAVQLPKGKFTAVATKHGINEKGLAILGYNSSLELEAIVPARSILILVDSESI
jgi:pullulanase